MKAHVRYFPFSPGIGWKIKHGKYVIPEINLDVWNKIILDKHITVVGYGGFIESYISLCYLEMLNYITPTNTIYWCGDSRFNYMIYLNGIAKVNQSATKEILTKYPVPIFMDTENNIYFNYLSNVLNVKPYYGGKGYKDKSPIIKQLLRNSTLPWDKQYIPKFRKSSFPTKDFLQWSRITRFDLNKPFICIFQNLGLSNHKPHALNLNDTHIKALSAMLRQSGVYTVVFTNTPGKFYNSSAYCVSPAIETILHMVKYAKVVLSEEIDFLLLTMISSSAKIIMNPVDKCFSIAHNAKYLNVENDKVFLAKKWNSLEIFNIIDQHGKL